VIVVPIPRSLMCLDKECKWAIYSRGVVAALMSFIGESERQFQTVSAAHLIEETKEVITDDIGSLPYDLADLMIG
jgi:hypothetical protein